MMQDSKYCNEESTLDQEAEWDTLTLKSHRDEDDSWEVLTEVESVLSFDVSYVSSVVTKPSSYKDALLREGIVDYQHDQTTFRGLGKVKKKKKLKHIKENNAEAGTELDEFGFDAIQMMEGIKYGRGGKAPQWLKNNKKTKKNSSGSQTACRHYTDRDADRMCSRRRINLKKSCDHDIGTYAPIYS